MKSKKSVPERLFMEDKLKELSGKGVEFVKYQFTDMQGNMREVTLTIGEIKGIGSTSVDGSSVFGKIIPPTESDMLLVPDCSTLTMVPWSRDTARVICNVFYPPEREGGKMIPFEGCCRGILADLEKLARKVLTNHLNEIFLPRTLSDNYKYYNML
jgi:glutamine synthetase